MKYKKPLTKSEVLKNNFKAYKKWLSSNKSKIKPKPGNKAIFYAGNSIDAMLKRIKEDFLGRSSSSEDDDIRVKEGIDEGKIITGIYKQIERSQKELKANKTSVEYEMLKDVLKRLKTHPELIDRDRNDKLFAHASEYFDELKNFPDLFPKPEIDKAWDDLCTAYAQNVDGDVKLIAGAADDFRNIGGDKYFVRTEFQLLLRNKKLSEKTKKELKNIVGTFMAKFDSETKQAVKKLLREQKKLEKGGVT